MARGDTTAATSSHQPHSAQRLFAANFLWPHQEQERRSSRYKLAVMGWPSKGRRCHLRSNDARTCGTLLGVGAGARGDQRRPEAHRALYKLNCWFDYLGRVPRDKRNTSGAGFSHDAERANEGVSAGDEGVRPDLAELERNHEAQLKKGLESNIRYAPQGGTVKISHPAPAIRHAELKRDMAIYNDSHGSYWNNSNVRVLAPPRDKAGLPNSELAALAGLPEREIYSHRFARGSLRAIWSAP